MNQLEHIFDELGVSQYLGAFVDQGFDSWETILDITESDLDALGVKLGHRRKLQRRIANYRGVAPAASLVSPTRASIEDPSTNAHKTLPPETKDGVASTKRKYRRHPKPDENAPERPPSAYVLFSNKMREDLRGQNLSFTEIAKLVGENWQALDRFEKEPYETQAQDLKERYNRDMAEYKKTPDYKRYCDYLADFRKRQASHVKDTSKRPRVDGESSTRGTASGRVSVGPSATNSNAGSGSDSQPGSEPPPTRQQRPGSIATQADSRMSPVVPNHAFTRQTDDASQSPLPIPQDDSIILRNRGYSSPGSRDNLDHHGRRLSGLREGFRPDAPSGFGLPALSSLGDPRVTMAPISHSPDGGVPSVVPNMNTASNSTRTSASSKYWSGPPSLRTDQSSTGSTSSLNSFAPPRTPSESSLPIHALLSAKPETPTPQMGAIPKIDGLVSSKAPSIPPQPLPGRAPEQAIDGRPPYSNGMPRLDHSSTPGINRGLPGTYPPITSNNHLPPVAPHNNSSLGLTSEQPPALSNPGLDGMSALLRASDIVGRQNQ